MSNKDLGSQLPQPAAAPPGVVSFIRSQACGGSNFNYAVEHVAEQVEKWLAGQAQPAAAVPSDITAIRTEAEKVFADWYVLASELPQDDRIEDFEWGAMQDLRRALAAVPAHPAAEPARGAIEITKLRPIAFANVTAIEQYAKHFEVGPHLPGVRDVGLYTKDQLKAAVSYERLNQKGAANGS